MKRSVPIDKYRSVQYLCTICMINWAMTKLSKYVYRGGEVILKPAN